MLIEEYVEDGKYVNHYSDKGMYIRQVETGILYCAALDLVPCKFTYEETDQPIEEPEEEPEEVINGQH